MQPITRAMATTVRTSSFLTMGPEPGLRFNLTPAGPLDEPDWKSYRSIFAAG